MSVSAAVAVKTAAVPSSLASSSAVAKAAAVAKAPTVANASASSSSSAIGKVNWLKAEGDHLVDEQGKTVILRGVNLGGWLVEEMWMMPFEQAPPKNSTFKPITDHVSLWSTIEARFGKTELERIRKALRKAWMSDADFSKIKASGLNCVRLPFLCDSMDEPEGLFPLLDAAIESAKKRGLYVILDMHGTYGRQSAAQHTGCENSNQMFSNPELVKKTISVWEKIAERYKDRPEVAGYDLMNEPMGIESRKELHFVHDQMYQAIRKIDKRHLIFIEDGFKGIDHIPAPAKTGWNNVVFSAHIYAKGKKTESEFLEGLAKKLTKFTECQAKHKVPLYVGEFNFQPFDESDKIKKFIQTLQEKKISWSHWTYKFAGQHGRRSTWGLYSRPQRLKQINPFRDSVQEILIKIQQLFTLNFDLNLSLEKLFRET